MNITVVLVALIVGFVVITVFSLMSLLFVRRREREKDAARAKEDTERITKTIEELDAALDEALNEINRLGALVNKEIEEKHKAMLFLYNLVEDKQKEIEESADSEVISEMMQKYIETHGEKLKLMSVPMVAAAAGGAAVSADTAAVLANAPEETPAEPVKPPTFANAKHKQIWEMSQGGQKPADIAKELGIGQGEVSLILNILKA